MFSKIVTKSLDTLEKDELRRKNALETLYLLVAGILHHRFSNWSSDVASILAGKEKGAVDAQFLRLITAVGNMLFVDSEDIRRLAINLFITLLTANNSLEDNFIVKYFIEARMEEKLLQLTVSQPVGITRRDLLSIITLLAISSDILEIGASKAPATQSLNSYARMLRTCEGGPFLKHTIALLEHDMRVALRHRGRTPYEEESSTVSTASLLTGWLRSSSPTPSSQLIDDEELKYAQASPSECFLSHPGLSFLAFHFLAQFNEFFVKSLFFPTTIGGNSSTTSKRLPSATVPPLICDLFELASFFLPSVEPKGYVYSRLLLTTFLVLVENTEVSFRLHDARAKLLFSGEKRKSARPAVFDMPVPLASQMVDLCHIFLRNHMSLDSFIGGELAWICELYSTCLQVLHRLLCFQKKMHIRVAYPWKSLWATLMAFLLSFCAAILVRSVEPKTLELHVLPVIHHVLTLFNIGITFGDAFLPSPTDYDELYYEIIRCEREFKIIISSIDEIASKVQDSYLPPSEDSSDDSEHDPLVDLTRAIQDGTINELLPEINGVSPSGESEPEKVHEPAPAVPLPKILATIGSDLFNLRSILEHFSEKIGHFLVANPNTPLSGPLVISMIKSNYENLRLKLQDDIDQFEKYDPSNTTERKMLRRYAKVIVQDLKLKRYTEIEAAISHPVSSKLFVHSGP